MQNTEQMQPIYAANGGSTTFSEETITLKQNSNEQDIETPDSKDKKQSRRYWSTKEEDCFFEIWGRDNWRLTQHGKHSLIYQKWSEEMKTRFGIELKPLEIQSKVNTTRLKFRQVLKQFPTDKNAIKRWKRFSLIEQILRNQYRGPDAEPISSEAMKKNRDLAFMESMSTVITEVNVPTDDGIYVKTEEIVGNVDANVYTANAYDDNNRVTFKSEVNEIPTSINENGQHEQIYQYLQQQQQTQSQQIEQQQVELQQQQGLQEQHKQIESQQQQQQQQQHDHLIIANLQQATTSDYFDDRSEPHQGQIVQHMQHQQQPLPQKIHLQQQQQNVQYDHGMNTYMNMAHAPPEENTMHVSVIQTNQPQTQQILQQHQSHEQLHQQQLHHHPQQQQQQQQQAIMQEQYQQPVILPPEHQQQGLQQQQLHQGLQSQQQLQPTATNTIFTLPQIQKPQPHLNTNNWLNQKPVTIKLPTELPLKRSYKASKVLCTLTKNATIPTDYKSYKPLLTLKTPIAESSVFSSTTFPQIGKRRMSTMADSKEILKYRADWLQLEDLKKKKEQAEQEKVQQVQVKIDVSSNSSLVGATDVEKLYLAEIGKRNKILDEQKKISQKLLELEERKLNMMESFFPKCLRLQEQFVEHVMRQPCKEQARISTDAIVSVTATAATITTTSNFVNNQNTNGSTAISVQKHQHQQKLQNIDVKDEIMSQNNDEMRMRSIERMETSAGMEQK